MSPSLPPALIEFMRQHQYRPEPLKSSGDRFLRFPVGNDSNGKTSGYVKLFPDGEGAVFGDFKSGLQAIWSAIDVATLPPEERTARQAALEEAREGIQEEQRGFRAAAADKAAEIYGRAEEAKADHPYLLKKHIIPYGGLRQFGTQLFVPVYLENKLTSLQFIEEDGAKRFLTGGEIRGGCCVLGTPADIICIAEGYATGCSIHDATGHAVAVAFNAGNLMHVAQAMRQLYKEAFLILCADNDRWTEGNPGLTRATEAALAVGGSLAVPYFSGCDMSTRPTDFNDLHVLSGKEVVSGDIAAATKVNEPLRPISPRLPGPSSHVLPKLASVLPVQNASYRQPAPDHHMCANGSVEGPPATLVMKASDEIVLAQADDSATTKVRSLVQLREMFAPLAPPRMLEAGFPSLVTDIVEVACHSSEAHRVAVAANVLAYFSAILGRGVFSVSVTQ